MQMGELFRQAKNACDLKIKAENFIDKQGNGRIDVTEFDFRKNDHFILLCGERLRRSVTNYQKIIFYQLKKPVCKGNG